MTPAYLSAKHAAEHFDFTYRQFDQMVRAHGLPCLRVGRVRRFKVAELEKALQALSARPRRKRAA